MECIVREKVRLMSLFILCKHAYAMIVGISVVKIEVFQIKTMIIFIFFPKHILWVHTEYQ